MLKPEMKKIYWQKALTKLINRDKTRISEYLIYKFPEESHLSAEKVAQKRHKELLKNNQAYVFFYKWSKDFLMDRIKGE